MIGRRLRLIKNCSPLSRLLKRRPIFSRGPHPRNLTAIPTFFASLLLTPITYCHRRHIWPIGTVEMPKGECGADPPRATDRPTSKRSSAEILLNSRRTASSYLQKRLRTDRETGNRKIRETDDHNRPVRRKVITRRVAVLIYPFIFKFSGSQIVHTTID